jgi:hypothetical protein
MLSADGQLTDIGAWYMGREPTGVLPSQGSDSSSFRSVMPQAGIAGLAALFAVAVLS